jgi:hypothetical protein
VQNDGFDEDEVGGSKSLRLGKGKAASSVRVNISTFSQTPPAQVNDAQLPGRKPIEIIVRSSAPCPDR